MIIHFFFNSSTPLDNIYIKNKVYMYVFWNDSFIYKLLPNESEQDFKRRLLMKNIEIENRNKELYTEISGKIGSFPKKKKEFDNIQHVFSEILKEKNNIIFAFVQKESLSIYLNKNESNDNNLFSILRTFIDKEPNDLNIFCPNMDPELLNYHQVRINYYNIANSNSEIKNKFIIQRTSDVHITIVKPVD
jgi:hypothetical protein